MNNDDFIWHMPDDATEGVAEHSSRLQPSINLHAPVTAFMFSWSDVRSRRDEGSGQKALCSDRSLIAPTQDSNPDSKS